MLITMGWTRYMLSELKIKERFMKVLILSIMYLGIFELLSCRVSNETKVEELTAGYYKCDYKKIEKLLSGDITLSLAVQNDLLRISLEINEDPKSALLLANHFNQIDVLYKGKTILYWSLELKDFESAKSLVVKGADLFSCNNDDIFDTPFSLALKTRNQNFIDWLVKDFLDFQNLNAKTVYRVFSGLLYNNYVDATEYIILNSKAKEKLVDCPDLIGLIVNNFYNENNRHVINELKKCRLNFDKDSAYFHMAMLLNEEDITSVIKWLEENHIERNRRYYFINHPCSVGMEYTTPAEFAALLSHFYSKTISTSDEIDSVKVLKYNLLAEYFKTSNTSKFE